MHVACTRFSYPHPNCMRAMQCDACDAPQAFDQLLALYNFQKLMASSGSFVATLNRPALSMPEVVSIDRHVFKQLRFFSVFGIKANIGCEALGLCIDRASKRKPTKTKDSHRCADKCAQCTTGFVSAIAALLVLIVLYIVTFATKDHNE